MRCAPTLAVMLLACEGVPGQTQTVVHLADFVDASGEGVAELEIVGDGLVSLDLGGRSRIVEVAVDAPSTMDATLQRDGDIPGWTTDTWTWFRPRPFEPGPLALRLRGQGTAQVTISIRGDPVPEVSIERSVVWHDELLDDSTVISFARIMAAVSSDGHGGLLLDDWFRRFASTEFSERTLPNARLEALRLEQGDDPSKWDLAQLPFRVTAIHNRLDLWATEGQCGQLRVTAATPPTDPLELHMIFLFSQVPADDDVAPDGGVHCHGTARRWGRLSQLGGAEFEELARSWLDQNIVFERFLMAETTELDVDWEWRQWRPTPAAESSVLDTIWVNQALFQTVSVEAVNGPGPLHDDFIAWIEDNAAAIAERRAMIPERFRARAERLAEDTHWPQLDLRALEPETIARYPTIARQLEIVGCPGCHTAPSTRFVQTTSERGLSEFQQLEVRARAELLDAMNAGLEASPPPFGPLQDDY